MAEYITTPDGRRWFPEEPGKPGEAVIFKCCCGQPKCHDELHVMPLTINGYKVVDLITRGAGGTCLNDGQREQLATILLDRNWFGKR